MKTVPSVARGGAEPEPEPHPDSARDRELRSLDDAVEHVHAICFKTGPPRRVGVELEWTVHHRDDPSRVLEVARLRAALGRHAPRTLTPDSPAHPLPHGGSVTVEPGGQVEISTPPFESLAQMHSAVAADLSYLTDSLHHYGLTLGEHGIDAYRKPRRLLRTLRYDAMESAFARRGVSGATMMSGTAATQVCLDAGEPRQVARRWEALHMVGPVLLALFANSSRHAGRDTGWASARMRAWLRTDPARTGPAAAIPTPTGPAAAIPTRGRVSGADPALAWAEYALAAPLLCVRRPTGGWHAPPGISFADWIGGALRPAPTVDDLDYHLGTLFPPVRPRGYVEARFLDAQPPRDWFVPVALVTALLATDASTERARELAAPATGIANGWWAAARHGLSDPWLRRAAYALADLACRQLSTTDLDSATRDSVLAALERRLASARMLASTGRLANTVRPKSTVGPKSTVRPKSIGRPGSTGRLASTGR